MSNRHIRAFYRFAALKSVKAITSLMGKADHVLRNQLTFNISSCLKSLLCPRLSKSRESRHYLIGLEGIGKSYFNGLIDAFKDMSVSLLSVIKDSIDFLISSSNQDEIKSSFNVICYLCSSFAFDFTKEDCDAIIESKFCEIADILSGVNLYEDISLKWSEVSREYVYGLLELQKSDPSKLLSHFETNGLSMKNKSSKSSDQKDENKTLSSPIGKVVESDQVKLTKLSTWRQKSLKAIERSIALNTFLRKEETAQEILIKKEEVEVASSGSSCASGMPGDVPSKQLVDLLELLKRSNILIPLVLLDGNGDLIWEDKLDNQKKFSYRFSAIDNAWELFNSEYVIDDLKVESYEDIKIKMENICLEFGRMKSLLKHNIDLGLNIISIQNISRDSSSSSKYIETIHSNIELEKTTSSYFEIEIRSLAEIGEAMAIGLATKKIH